MSIKFTRSHLLTIIYVLFTLLYTIYIAEYATGLGSMKGDNWWYYFKFLFFDAYVFFIFQGILLRSKNWGVLLLLPLVILPAALLGCFILLWVLRFGGGTLLDRDDADMITFSLIFIAISFFSLRFISTQKTKRKVKK